MRSRSPALDRSLVGFTQAANYSRLWLLIAGTLVVFGRRRGRRAPGRGVGSIATAATVANGPAKLLARRRRRSRSSAPALIRMPGSASFPSGHSAAAFAFATGACAELPWLAPMLVALAGAVAYSRMHTGVHYPSDVAAGIGIGVSSGVFAKGFWDLGPPPHLDEAVNERARGSANGSAGPWGGSRAYE